MNVSRFLDLNDEAGKTGEKLVPSYMRSCIRSYMRSERNRLLGPSDTLRENFGRSLPRTLVQV